MSLVTFGVENDAQSLDYTQSYSPSDTMFTSNISEPLLRANQQGKITPNVATSWDTSDPTKLVFKIRPGVRFHDGTPLTEQDVAFSLSRHLDPAVASLFNFYYTNVDHVAATGPLEVTIYMKQPDIQMLYVLAINAGGISSKAFIQKHGKQYGTPEVGAMGTGPYRFVSWTKDSSYTMEANPDYWNKAVPRKVHTFTMRVIPDEHTLLTALRSGEVDGTIGQLSGRGIASLSSASNISQYPISSGGASHMGFNLAHKPWDDVRVRRALSLVIPRAGLLDSVWGGQGILSKSMVPPAMWSYGHSVFASAYAALPDFAAGTGTTSANLAQARKLITQAGAHGATGSAWCSNSFDVQQAEAVQAAGAQIGLNINVNHTTFALQDAAQNSKKHAYDMTLGFTTPDIPDPANLLGLEYASTSSQNDVGYSNPIVDACLKKQARILNNPDERARLLTQAQALIVGGQIDPIFVSTNQALTLNSRLGGYTPGAVVWQYDPQFVGSISGT